MLSDIGIYSYASTALCMLLLVVFLIFQPVRNRQKLPLFLIFISSAIWSSGIAIDSYKQITSIVLLLECLRYTCWYLLLLSVLPTNHSFRRNLIPLIGSLAILLLIVAYPTDWASKTTGQISLPPLGTAKSLSLIAINIIALGMIEQIIRNGDEQERWKLKYILLTAGAIFTYDFCMFSDALMFHQTSEEFWIARGMVNTLTLPLIIIGIRRLGSRDLSIHISRNVIFHSAAVVTASIYLLLMSLAGYYVRYVDESLGNLFLLIFIFGSVVILASLLLSGKLRQNLRVLVNKHFFGLKHDYRQQWSDFTYSLASSKGEVPQQICQSIATLLNASGALLWTRDKSQKISLLAHWHIPAPAIAEVDQSKDLETLINFMEKTHWVIDLDEWQGSPEIYDELEIPEWLVSIPKAWLLIPLFYQDTVIGALFLKRSDISTAINWEDRDLLKLAGQQAAVYLAQHHAESALVEARQFEAYHRLSTYVMHDLKNILAQQSLLVANAEKHKSNPEFVDDMLATIQNSVERMQRLLKQMKSGDRIDEVNEVSIFEALDTAIANRCQSRPSPQLSVIGEKSWIQADSGQLITIFEHLIQNAQEATPDQGTITITLESHAQQTQISVQDSGCGMSAEFIQKRLFKPFDTTKGLAGMGIGMFESKQYITQIGGTLNVESTPDVGSEFTITLPSYLISQDTAEECSAENTSSSNAETDLIAGSTQA